MSNNPSSSVLRAVQLPELLAAFGSHLDPPALLHCVQVSRYWNFTLIPLLWQTIDDRLYSWPRIFKASGTDMLDDGGTKVEDWIQGIYTKYGHHIRDLHANWAITIFSAQNAGKCVNLRTLSCSNARSSASKETLALMKQCQDADVSIPYLSPVFKGAIEPLSGQEGTSEFHSWVFTQRFWLLVMQNPSLTGIQLSLNFLDWCFVLKGEIIRSILMSLPTLRSLQCQFGLKGFDFEKTLESIPQVQHIAVAFYPSRVPIFGKPFPHIRTLHCLVSLELSELLQLLRYLPNLDQLYMQSLRNVGMLTGKSKDFMDMSTCRLRGLYIYEPFKYVGEDLDRVLSELVLPWLPCLTELSHWMLEPSMAVAIGSCCPKFQSFRSFQNSPFHQSAPLHGVNAVGELLRRCHNLKTLDAIGHIIEAPYILAEPWVCRELETFRCHLIGMDRLTSEEEDFYKTRRAATDRDDQDKEESTWEQDGAQAIEVVEKNRRCHELHGQIYDRLAEMSRLRVLDFGCEHWDPFEMLDDPNVYEVDGRLYSKSNPPMSNTLELSLESGLSQLGALKNLEVLGFEGIDHRIGTKELIWMAESWPRLRIMRGLQEPYFQSFMDLKTEMLKKYMEELRPSVRHESADDGNLVTRQRELWSARR